MTYDSIGFRLANRPAPAGLFSGFWQGIRRRRSERLAVERLAHLDDHLLRDLGITRAGIPGRVRNG